MDDNVGESRVDTTPRIRRLENFPCWPKCEEVIKRKAMRVLIDTGTSVSLIRPDQYKRLWLRGGVRKIDFTIRRAEGREMTSKGMVWLPLRIGGTNGVHKLYVIPDLCREILLGEDWLCQYKAQLKRNPALLIVDRS